jgi:pimeloyl-ACP methyl ester carboxylesterase
LRRYLDRVDLPTLIIWGERDGFVSTVHGRAFHEGIAGSQFETLANAGHLPHVEAPEQCAELVSDFLRKFGA